MDSRDLFSTHRSSKKLNESLQKVFGKKINFENFSLDQLQDARNKLRTQLSQVRTESQFNETVENEAYHQAKFMLDAINAEIEEREEYIIDSDQTKDDELDEESEDDLDDLDDLEDDDDEYGEFPESIQGENMHNLREGEIQQAQSIVSAKTMVDRVGRWIEELSGMENDSLIQLGDQIRDEMGAEMAKRFISSVAPAIQQALDNLKTTRETLSSGVRLLTGEEQGAEMLGGETSSDMEAGPDTMNQEPEMGAEEPLDDFAAADAATGPDAAGREQRESIQYQNRLLKVLAG
jgi:hypothetical protein